MDDIVDWIGILRRRPSIHRRVPATVRPVRSIRRRVPTIRRRLRLTRRRRPNIHRRRLPIRRRPPAIRPHRLPILRPVPPTSRTLKRRRRLDVNAPAGESYIGDGCFHPRVIDRSFAGLERF